MAKTKLERFCDVLGVDAEQVTEKSKTRRAGEVSFAIRAYCIMSPDRAVEVAKALNLTVTHVNICRSKNGKMFDIFKQSEEYKQCKAILGKDPLW